MKRKVKIIGIFLAIVIFTSTAITFAFATRTDIKPSEYGIGIPYQTAMQDKKPFIAMFYADWCTYCMRFMPKMKILTEVYKDKYNFVMIDGDDPQNEKTAKDYGVAGFPTIYIIDPTIDNRILINQTLYDDLRSVRVELDRYLRIRAMIK